MGLRTNGPWNQFRRYVLGTRAGGPFTKTLPPALAGLPGPANKSGAFFTSWEPKAALVLGIGAAMADGGDGGSGC